MLFESWPSLFRVIASTVIGYIATIALIRTFGKRTLSKMSAFDFVVTIALGSMLATICLSDSVPLVEGVVAVGLLILIQYIVAWASVRSDRVETIIRGEPVLLAYGGNVLHDVLLRERVSIDEVRSAIRRDGYGDFDEVGAIVMENDGSFSVLPPHDGKRDSLEDVNIPDDA